MDDLLAEFVAETRELSAALAGELVAWETDPADRARLDAIFRFVHTIKGNCGFFDFPRLEALSHAAEDALDDVREGKREADAMLVSAVLAVIDRIATMTGQIERGETFDGDDSALIAALSGQASAQTAPAVIPESAPQAGQRTVRLPVELIDQVMSGVSEMVLARNELARRIAAEGASAELEAPFRRLSGLIDEVRDSITRTRMRRIEALFATFPRLVRDLSAELGRQVHISVESGDVEMDREMIELVRDPLLHIVRNAVDHGIEPPEARAAAGKPAAGTLTVSARQSGNTILIGVMDDGRGIDCERLVQKAIAAGLVDTRRAVELTRAEAIELIFEPGLSTAEVVTGISGRGVGMDVVRANIEKIGGSLEIESEPGEGTRFLIRVPLTLSILPSLTVTAGGQTFALPRSYVEEVVSCTAGQAELAQVGERKLLTFREKRLPCVPLAQALDLPPSDAEPSLFVVLRLGWGDLYALAVDQVHDHQDLVIKPLSPLLMQCGLFVGCTQLDDGTPVLVLDVAAIGYGSGIPRELQRPAKGAEPEAADDQGLAVVLLTGLDGVTRAIPLAMVEQVEKVSASAVRLNGPHAQVVLGDEIVALAGLVEAAEWPEPMPVLRLAGEAQGMAYAARAILDIESLATLPKAVGGDPARLALHRGKTVELVEPARLAGAGR